METVENTALVQSWLLQRERAVAWLRVGFAALAVLVIQLNPERIARFPILSALSLGSFLFYSFVVLYFTERKRPTATGLGILTTSLDVVWIAVIVFSTGGTRTPFFFYYSFPVITASVRWGLKGSFPVALVGVALYGAVRITLAAESMDTPIGIDTLLVRSMYLIVLAVIFGYISEFERKQNERLLALSKTAGEVATLQERRRIAFELHDGILQSLATLILHLENCRAHLPESQQRLTDDLRYLEEMSRNSMKQIRNFLIGKETLAFTEGSLVQMLRREARFMRDGMGLNVILESQPEDLDLPPLMEREIYYVLREALTNVRRHSHASKVEIQLVQSNGTLEGLLSDNGVGFSANNLGDRHCFGLAGMEQRIKKIGGELAVKSSPGKGTLLSFAVPTDESIFLQT